MALGVVRDDVRQGGLAGAGRPPQDDRRELVGLDGAAEQAPRPDDVLLPDEFIQRLGAHPHGQRRVAKLALFAGVIKEIGHGRPLG